MHRGDDDVEEHDRVCPAGWPDTELGVALGIAQRQRQGPGRAIAPATGL